MTALFVQSKMEQGKKAPTLEELRFPRQVVEKTEEEHNNELFNFLSAFVK